MTSQGVGMKALRFYVGLWLGKLAAAVINLIDKNRGTNTPGVVAMKICPDFLSMLKDIDYQKMVFITGTNGKSTSNNMFIHALKTAGKSVTTNLSGANLITGVATAMLHSASLTGHVNTEFFVFETDERFLPKIYKHLPAKNICITNIQKDQVQRNGEPDYIYKIIRDVLNKDVTVFVNDDEPRCKSLGAYAGRVVRYGVAKNDRSFTKDGFYDVGMPCPHCGHALRFHSYNIDNVGSYTCPSCGFSGGADADYRIDSVNYQAGTFTCGDRTYVARYTEPYFLYGYALCLALCNELNVPLDQVAASFKTFKNIGGRLENLSYKGKTIKYIRIKQENPETLQSAFDFVARDPEPKLLMLGLEQLEDFQPYYTNTFYAFDCDVDALIHANLERVICFSEAVAYDTANRLIYGGMDQERISVLPTDSDDALLDELDKFNCENVYLITWLHKYEELERDIPQR